ncbi:hypothetical protein JCM17823_01770 [Halorubrum gandharaense]
MAPTLVNAALGALVAAALLGFAFDRRSLAVVVGAAVFPSLDAVAGLVVFGATNALFHTVWIPLAIGGLLYYDTAVRPSENSWLRRRHGAYGVRVGWVALASLLVAGIAPDLFGRAGVNLLYPFHDAYYLVRGRLLLSTREGLVQTVVSLPHLGADSPGVLPLQSPGTTESYTIPTAVNPDGRPGLGGGDRAHELSLLRTGWQAVVVAAAAAVVAVRRWEGDL